MKPVLHALASLKLSLAGFALLAAATFASYLLPTVPQGTIAAPLALLALNLAAAMLARPALRRGGLGLFHLALLVLLLLAGWGRLFHFDARVEVLQGGALDPAHVEVTGRGPLHGNAWRRISFRQGGWQVDYAPGMRRAHTRSEVLLPGESLPRTVGDDTPLVIDGYRLYTTHNKGFAPVISWQPDAGPRVQGALHMPSYPLFDWKQENRWTAPGGEALGFWLRVVDAPTGETAWTLDPRHVRTVLVVETGGVRHELSPGDALRVGGATLRYERLAGWMGYRIFHDPTLLPMLFASVAGILALAWHLFGRGVRLLPLREGAAA
ncbi:hypothetical protein [Ramlibacter albus]|uniref:ResB-like domain-containing protein n=1 Tax=Ramlibacter albus TaxID=2079448 RepID=A0A923M619_9BURK|nr:hypothetical protein [Ramlibacter albus]MBC5764035.1 hypothetical protein [Ramlibacter albus]